MGRRDGVVLVTPPWEECNTSCDGVEMNAMFFLVRGDFRLCFGTRTVKNGGRNVTGSVRERPD